MIVVVVIVVVSSQSRHEHSDSQVRTVTKRTIFEIFEWCNVISCHVMSCGDDGSDGHARQTDSQSAIMMEIVTVRVMVLVVESSDGNGCVMVTSEQFMFVMVMLMVIATLN